MKILYFSIFKFYFKYYSIIFLLYLFVWEKMKKAEPAGIGCFFVAMLNSDIRRGLADTPCSVPSSGRAIIFTKIILPDKG